MEQTNEFPSAMEQYYDTRYILQSSSPNLPYQYFDLLDAETKLLLHFIGPNLSTTITDSSLSGHVITEVGSTIIKTDQYKFGNSSLYLDGVGDYVTTGDSADWFFDTKSMTIEMWIRPDGIPAADFDLYLQHIDANNSVRLYWDSANAGLRFTVVSATVTLADYFFEWTPSSATWYHIALTRYLNNVTYFIDGVTGDWTGINTAITNTTSFPDLATSIRVGESFKGWMSEVRVSNGIARWLTDFTLPTIYYSYINCSTLLVSDRVGIGISSPRSLLDVTGSSNPMSLLFNSAVGGEAIALLSGVSASGVVYSETGYMSIWRQPIADRGTITNVTEVIRFTETSDIVSAGILAQAATTGTNLLITAGGSIRKDSSSRKYKKNERVTVIDTSWIYNVELKDFEYKKDKNDTNKIELTNTGWIAEDIYILAPHRINLNINNEPESINYRYVVTDIIEEVKKLKLRIKELEKIKS